MANGEFIAYGIASSVCALFILEFGADNFIDHTAIVAEHMGIFQSVMGLLTASAEWEELAVVVVFIARHRSSLAVPNIVGSSISNILGAFSLGLIFHKDEGQIIFDGSSNIYTLLLLLLTILVAGLGEFATTTRGEWLEERMTAPEQLSDGDSDSDSDGDNENSTSEEGDRPTSHDNANASIEGTIRPIRSAARTVMHESSTSASIGGPVQSTTVVVVGSDDRSSDHSTSASNLLVEEPQTTLSSVSSGNHNDRHSVTYHVGFLVLGLLAILLSSYVLSHAASNLVDEIGISDVLFGVVVLSVATTLPGKFVAVMSGSRGHAGILVANTVASNIFLLSLCMGALWVSTGGAFDQGSVNASELGTMFASTLALTFTVWFGARWSRCLGVTMLLAYVAFLVLEVTVVYKV
ncbi:uncharacterized protein PV06_00534 [Exophiala oligosperma]|uniref:Sodium/calcium exchanger membrane region domain-containing protein n=1 Tax=Exophiala oligosperma TaxID=215243 RepID=A0A0D2DXQ4_9EURO|nr:uncharacterized protein PV06_00534 [Exophiala oligosperma]KIW47878.1 hypothetical protein PV06_00534 [Exophiala oligosperma]